MKPGPLFSTIVTGFLLHVRLVQGLVPTQDSPEEELGRITKFISDRLRDDLCCLAIPQDLDDTLKANLEHCESIWTLSNFARSDIIAC